MRIKSVFIGAVALFAPIASAQAQVTTKIGILNDRSSLYADLSGEGSVIVAKMAVEDYKAATKSGINVEIVSADHQNKPDIAVNTAREWFDKQGVDAIFDVPNSGAALAVNEIIREKNKVFVNSGAATSDLTGAKCSANTVHWTYDTWMLANSTGSAIVKQGGTSWYFITADYAFGAALERDTSDVVKANGGTVVGGIKHPLNTQDFSSFLLQGQSSGAKVIGLANAGGDTINSIKQAGEFGITQAGQNLAGLLIFLTDIHSLGLKTAQGLTFTATFYWDMNDQTRAFADRFMKETKRRPTMVNAGVYAGVMHYLKAVDALKDAKDGKKTVEKMKELPTDDILFGKGSIRKDGRKIHDAYLFQVKKPEESKGAWDYYKLLATTPADKAFRPLEQGGCSLVVASK